MLKRILCLLFGHISDKQYDDIKVDGFGYKGKYRLKIADCERCENFHFRQCGYLNPPKWAKEKEKGKDDLSNNQ